MFLINKTSQLVQVLPEMPVSIYEKRLNTEGYTGGYIPITGWETTLNQALADRIPNLFALKYGGIEELCVGGKALTSEGDYFEIKAAPRAATGLDFRKALIGSQEKLGSFQEVVLRIFSLPEAEVWGLFFLTKTEQAKEILRKMLGWMIEPLWAGVWDAEETKSLMNLLKLDKSGAALLVVRLSGSLRFMEAIKETLTDAYQENKIKLHWVKDKKRIRTLREEYKKTGAQRLQSLQLSPLLGGYLKPVDDKMDRELLKSFGELK